MRFQYHHETRVTLNTGIDTAFAYLDRFEALSAHMEKRSPMMMGSRMHIDTDERGGRAVGSKVRMSGRVLGVALSLEEVVTERDPPRFKAWETREVRLLAIGHYRLGFELDSAGDGVDLRVFIEFQPPGWPGGRWLGRTSARIYARWCTRRIAHDAMRHFGGAVDLVKKRRNGGEKLVARLQPATAAIAAVQRGNMAARWVAAAMLLVMLAVVGIFLWAIIRPPPSPAEGAAGTPVALEKRIADPAAPWTLAAQVVPRADRTVAVTVSAKDLEGRPLASPAAPTAVLRMLDMAMEDERVVLVQEAPGSWRGVGRVSMAGRWSLRVQFNGESLSLSFQAVSL